MTYIAEITMTNAESLTQRFIFCNFTVQFLNAVNQNIECVICESFLILNKAFRIKARFNIKEANSASKEASRKHPMN